MSKLEDVIPDRTTGLQAAADRPRNGLVRINEVLPGLFRDLAKGAPPAVAWKYRALADELELGEEQEAA